MRKVRGEDKGRNYTDIRLYRYTDIQICIGIGMGEGIGIGIGMGIGRRIGYNYWVHVSRVLHVKLELDLQESLEALTLIGFYT